MLALAAAVAVAGCRQDLPVSASVRRVIDGDTIELSDGQLVRYLGLDAPELHRRTPTGWVRDPEPFAEAAATRNRELVEGRQVRLEYDGPTRDRFGRLLAFVSVDGTLVNAVLVTEGLARAWAGGPASHRTQELVALAAQARRARRGVWATNP